MESIENTSSISGDIRLAVDSGITEIGANRVLKSIRDNTAKLVIMAEKGKKESILEVEHLAKITKTKVIALSETPAGLGAICGKPYPVSMISIIEPGHSGILKNFGGE